MGPLAVAVASCILARVHSLPRLKNSSTLTDAQSPDKSCTLRLGLIAHSPATQWMMALPVFLTPESLNSSEWQPYLEDLYGPLAREDFPIDTRCFLLWWPEHMPRAGLQLLAPHILPLRSTLIERRAAPTERMINAMISDKSLKRMLGLHTPANITRTPPGTLNLLHGKAPGQPWPMALYLYVYRGFGWPDIPEDERPLMAPFPSDTRVEVYHDGTDCVGRFELGYWMHYAPGSGIFFDTGRTLAVYGSDNRLCPLLFAPGSAMLERCKGKNMPRAQHTMIQGARAQGYDSLQVIGHRAGTGLILGLEIIDVNSDCDMAYRRRRSVRQSDDNGACPPEGHLSRGRTRIKPCGCNSSWPYAHMLVDGSHADLVARRDPARQPATAGSRRVMDKGSLPIGINCGRVF
jgi:hypothetical protein